MSAVSQSLERDLRSLLEGDVEFDRVSRRLYATDAGLNEIEPLGVVSPRHAEDVARLVSFASRHALPLVPRGAGSGLAGGAVGAGIQVDFTRYMNRVLEVAADGSWVRVQPGLVLAVLNDLLKPYGTFFAPDPSSENYCSVGGMIGTNSSGARTVAYGATKDHVLALELVLADASRFAVRALAIDSGELACLLSGSDLGPRACSGLLPELSARKAEIAAAMPRVVKNCSGYRVETIVLSGNHNPARPVGELLSKPDDQTTAHLQRLFIGAEGTLGLVTEATLGLVALPARRGVSMAYFPSVFAAGEAVPSILALRPSALEIMDSRFLAMVRRHDSRLHELLPGHADTALLVEFEGIDEDEVRERFLSLEHSLSAQGITAFRPAHTADEAACLWALRKSAVALALRMPGPRRAVPFIEDVTVHPTEVPAYVEFLQRLFDREGIEAVMYGHLGDGNIHTRPLLDPKSEHDRATMQRLYDEVSEYVLSVRGTMSGEHGDGLLRTPYLERMYGPEMYGLFSRIKKAFDPMGLMNPGKKVAPQEGSGSLLRSLRYGETYQIHPETPLLNFSQGEYEGEVEKCHGCAQCKSLTVTTMCPVYKATKREHASPRAKANLLRSIISERLDMIGPCTSLDVKAVADYCIVCGMCAVECPSGVNIPKLMLEAKARLRSAQRTSRIELLLGRTELVSRFGRATAPVANRLMNRPLLRRMAEPLTGIDRRRPLPQFAAHTFTSRGSRRSNRSRATGTNGELVAYFHDLFANYNDPGLAFDVERVLIAHGVRVAIPRQRASAIPEMLYGFADRARETALANMNSLLPLVAQGALVVASEPTASFAFKVHYSDYLDTRECSLLAAATRDLSDFLLEHREHHPASVPAAARIDLTADHPDANPLRIAYHAPCHLKAQRIGSPSLKLLGEIPGVEVIDLDAGCCGMAGTFGMKATSYDLSMKAGEPLFRRIEAVAPDLLATECSTCRLQLTHATALPVVHPITLLAEAYLSQKSLPALAQFSRG